jgi:hypothetical protein
VTVCAENASRKRIAFSAAKPRNLAKTVTVESSGRDDVARR